MKGTVDDMTKRSELVVVVLNGWGASSRRRETRTAELVRDVVKGLASEENILTRRSMLGMNRARLFHRFILSHQDDRRSLLVVGKSLGARNMVGGVLNRLPRSLAYRRTGLVTIDPCWPVPWDLTPNLNRSILHLRMRMGRATNFLAVRPQDEQAGSMVQGPGVVNVPLSDVTHTTIVQAPEVRSELEEMVEWLVEPLVAVI